MSEQTHEDLSNGPRLKRKAPSSGSQVPPQPKNIELSSTGDVVFRLQDDSKLRVQAAILRNASPVFGAMLGPHFSEGQDLGEQPKEIPLPGDDPAAIKILFAVLHHQYDVSNNPPLEFLTTLAVTVDKYLCQSVMKPFATM
ncbi:hypothetical protein HDK64DRAFT_297642 [Phyllosticta capitalensis]